MKLKLANIANIENTDTLQRIEYLTRGEGTRTKLCEYKRRKWKMKEHCGMWGIRAIMREMA